MLSKASASLSSTIFLGYENHREFKGDYAQRRASAN